MMNNENGRSMVEMLGVLAIIGVLSVAGIAGYSMAMKKYKTNEILNAASQLVVLAQAKYVSTSASAEAKMADIGVDTVAGYKMKATCTGTGANDCTVDVDTGNQGSKTADEWKNAVSAAGSTYYKIAS